VSLIPEPECVVIGDDSKLALGSECATGFDEETVLNDAIFVVARLGPGVGEVEVED